MASGESKWISSAKSREQVHNLRFESDAVLIGGNTLRSDNPHLGIRIGKYSNRNKQNKKIIVANPYTINFKDYDIFNDYENLILFSTVKEVKPIDCSFNILFPEKEFNWVECLAKIYSNGVNSVLVEGGAMVSSTLLQSRLVDKVTIFQAPIFLGNGKGFTDFLEIDSMKDRLKLKKYSLD